MQLEHVTFTGPPIDDPSLLVHLPANLAGLLKKINGFIQFHGGLHIRGACLTPGWHSLRQAWHGENAFWRLYGDVHQSDIPFAEDCLGDQFLLRDSVVCKLAAETGEVISLGHGLREFFVNIAADPVQYLSLHPLLMYQQNGGQLTPGQLLVAYPPFCTKESANGVSLTATSTDEQRQFLADLAAQLRNVSHDGKFEFRIND